MEDRFVKYSKLYFIIFGLFLAVPIFITLFIGFFYGFFKIFASRPLDIFYELVVVVIPPALFATVYYIFIKRTRSHPSKPVKIISQLLFVIAFCICAAILIIDLLHYFKITHGGYDISQFKSYSLAFMAGNIALMFIIALLQAFTTKKEEDWLQKRKRREGNGIMK
jgi:predicted permease